MKIISWNVNGIRAAEKKGFTEWIATCGADIVCIQETKAHSEQLSDIVRTPVNATGMRYSSFFASARRPGYSGTAMYALKKPDSFDTLGIRAFDDEGRVSIARYGKLAIISAYFPNSQEGGARLSYKLDFCREILTFCNAHVAQGGNIVLCGDYNIAHKPIDLANPKANEQNPGYLPEERAWMDMFLEAGYCDTFRNFCKEPNQYTWWSYRFHAREKNIGWRLDYACVNAAFLSNVRSSTILSSITGSDHCPIAIEIDV
ncbi:MAG: exodeoxyribonuclease III [Treponema sp.]|nr:exodeoxyribonuclease III [Treponema sp.]